MMRVLQDASWPLSRVHPTGDYEWVRDAWAQRVRDISQGWVFMSQGAEEAEGAEEKPEK